MNTNPSTAPTILDYHRQNALDHYNRPRGTCLGAGCCPECGRPECTCDEGELIPVLAEMHARFARAKAKLDTLTRREN